MQMIPMYSTKNFEDIYDSVETFMDDYGQLGLPKTISDQNAQNLFYLLYSRYGNSPIANLDENQFKVKLQAVIWQFGPTWEKKLDIQAKVRNLTESELMKGSEAIHNHAYDPTTSPSTAELTYIDQQNTSKYKKSKMDAYAEQWDLLDNDVTNDFLSKFQKLFKQFVRPEVNMIYESEI